MTAAHEDGASIHVLPELWASSFVGAELDHVLEDVRRAERELETLSGDLDALIVGSNYESVDGKAFNAASVWQSGELLGRYRKTHLFSPHGEDRMFEAGDAPLVVDTRFGRIAVIICYDLRFPELVRELALAGAEILIVPAQWPEPREQHWNVLARARAIEEQCFVIGTNRCGVEASLVSDQDIAYPGNSLIVAPTGEVLAEGNGEAGVIAAELRLKEVAIMRRAIPVLRDRRPELYDAVRTALTPLRPATDA